MIPVGEIGFLRAPEQSDLKWLMHLENDMTLWYVATTKEPFSTLTMQTYLARHQSIVTDQQLRLIFEVDGDPVGAVDVFDYDPTVNKAGVGIILEMKHRGKGWSKPMLAAFEQYCSKVLNIQNLYAHVPLHNEPSLALFTAAEYTIVGDLKNWIWMHGNHDDVRLFQKIMG